MSTVGYAERNETTILKVASVLGHKVGVGHPIACCDHNGFVRLDVDVFASLLGAYADNATGFVLIALYGGRIEQYLPALFTHSAQDGKHVGRAAMMGVHSKGAQTIFTVLFELFVL